MQGKYSINEYKEPTYIWESSEDIKAIEKYINKNTVIKVYINNTKEDIPEFDELDNKLKLKIIKILKVEKVTYWGHNNSCIINIKENITNMRNLITYYAKNIDKLDNKKG